MAYNWFLSQADELQDSADNFIEHLVVLIRASGWEGMKPAREADPKTRSEPPVPAGPQPVSAGRQEGGAT